VMGWILIHNWSVPWHCIAVGGWEGVQQTLSSTMLLFSRGCATSDATSEPV
jgi:hypothetical protein